jgi:chaperonin GroES
MTLQPTHDRVLLKRKEAETQTKGGVYIPGAAQEKSHQCIVIAVGPGRFVETTGKVVPLKIEAGDTVLIGKWSGDEVKVGDVDHILVRDSDILAVVT